MTSHDTYCKYVERILPLLSLQQMVKHVAFSQLVQNNWGLPQTKYLWIHYDEKWFFGFLRRANAKMCAELGIKKH
jgi:hypothetical protein